jgi:RimJ/RimL family protein N-acetyltransferase
VTLASRTPVVGDGWPVFGLRIVTPDLLLRPMTEADLAEVADKLPDDVTLDPSLRRFPTLSTGAARRTAVHQGYWRSLGTWTTDEWQLPLVVLLAGELIGVQTLEGTRFQATRTVDSASHLSAAVRGRGLGRQMRRGILTFAFDQLGAERAITSAWHHNRASLGVSRRLGYRVIGQTEEPSDSRPGTDTMVHLELRRGAWQTGQHADGIEVHGFDGCAPYFGV